MTKEKIAEIRAEFRMLNACRKDRLKEMVLSSHRIVDLTGADKRLLIAMLLEAKFGQKAFDLAFEI